MVRASWSRSGIRANRNGRRREYTPGLRASTQRIRCAQSRGRVRIASCPRLTSRMIMAIIMTMIMVNIHEAKAKLSEYLEAVANGERVLICKRNQPVAELRAVEQKRTEPRPLGGAKGIVIPPSFFDPMPDDFLDAFESGPVFPETNTSRPLRVAESRGTYRAPARRKRQR